MSDTSFHFDLPGLLLILSAPSGAGKTTLVKRLLSSLDDAVVSVSYTTRPPRGKERHGVDYFFVDDSTFDKMVEDGAFAEWAKVHGARYGTPISRIEENLAKKRVVLFDIDVQGGEQILAAYPRAVAVLIAPPSMQVLEGRLRDRSTDDESSIQRRLAIAREELARGAKSYCYLVVNDELERAHEELEAIVLAERLRLDRLGQEDCPVRITAQ